ncbi:hypothetical protein pb186bvf_015157 [Paramecium bursaria]
MQQKQKSLKIMAKGFNIKILKRINKILIKIILLNILQTYCSELYSSFILTKKEKKNKIIIISKLINLQFIYVY